MTFSRSKFLSKKIIFILITAPYVRIIDVKKEAEEKLK